VTSEGAVEFDHPAHIVTAKKPTASNSMARIGCPGR
jgi:hypothetical protein